MMMKMIIFMILWCCFLLNVTAMKHEYFTSIAGIDELLQIEQSLFNDLKQYVEFNLKYLKILQKDINGIEMEHNAAFKDVEGYIANPINVYKLINRLYINWDIYEEQMNNLIYILKFMKKKKHHFNLPSEEDFNESALSLLRLQQTYQLPTSQIAAGILNGVKYSNDMSWLDCWILSEQLFQMKVYDETKVWLQETVKRLFQDYYHILDNSSLIYLENIGNSLAYMEVCDAAWKVHNLIAQVEPIRYKTLTKLLGNTTCTPDIETEQNETNENSTLSPYHDSNEFKLYEKICRGEIRQSPQEQRNLYCKYEKRTRCAFCYLAPFKVEIVSHDPLIRILHGIISNKAIETIKQLALPSMKRSEVFAANGGSIKRNYRISKNTWLPYHQHPHLMNILRNIHDLSGLDMTYSEQLQVANYGLGGHYEPHFDFFLKNIPQQPGNRISTAVFYLSDVEEGGATVFPHLRVSVKPVKGTVLFWYNLHRSTDRDYRTKHGACPVLKGSKWIGNVWTHERNQELLRPCLLYRDHEISLPYKIIK